MVTSERHGRSESTSGGVHLAAVMAAITLVKPLKDPVVFEQNTAIALDSSRIARIGGVIVIATALIFYFLFSTAGLAG